MKSRWVAVSYRATAVAAWLALGVPLVWPASGLAQEAPAQPPDVHEHVAVTAPLLTPSREISGTAWVPQVTPMYGIHRPWHGWDVRLNGSASVLAVFEPGTRHRTGGSANNQVGIANWGMFMARRSVGSGRVGMRTMLSAEPWTISDCGTLSFLATGEVCEGDSIHDRQQPHDFVMELAADYERPLRGTWRWQVYGGLAGEPALGPPGYSHRESARANPAGPITHHWLDATQVSYGLVTLGFHNQRWKTEVSAFNGRDADDSRVDMDLGGFDSFSARVSFLPTERVALQVSAGRLREAGTEFPFPDQDPVIRVTASALYHVPLRGRGMWATTLAVGANKLRQSTATGLLDTTTVGALLESSVTLPERHTLFFRGEVAGMPGHHLHAHEYATTVFGLGKIQAGYVFPLPRRRGIVPGVGGMFMLSFIPPGLVSRYSGRTAAGFGLFLNLQPASHQM